MVGRCPLRSFGPTARRGRGPTIGREVVFVREERRPTWRGDVDHTFDAVVVGAPMRADVRVRLDALRGAGAAVVVLDADGIDAALDGLASRGVTGGLVLVIADAGVARERVVSVVPGEAAAILDDQLRRRAERRVPAIDDDPAWVVRLPETSALERVAESLGTVSNGRAAVRAAREEDGSTAVPMFAVNGAYTDGPLPGLLHGPLWYELAIASPVGGRRLLDLRTGVLHRAGTTASAFRSVRFVSAAAPHVVAMRAEAVDGVIASSHAVTAPGGDTAFTRSAAGDVEVARTGGNGPSEIVLACRETAQTVDVDARRCVERVAAWVLGGPDRDGDDGEALAQLAAADRRGFDGLLADHRAAWAERWADAEVTIEGSPDDELAARFAVFHLLGLAPDSGEAAVGARGLSGDAYGGHVFWDADVFVLPALVAIRPRAARAMLEYRIRRIDAARRAAAASGRAGARFPWESADSGVDVTPSYVRGAGGRIIPIRTGRREDHIVADVAWSADRYDEWTGGAFLGPAGAGRDLVLEGARYWASRVRWDRRGAAHVYGVIGPDEYHEVVDDNAYTNVMARWNLRRGARLIYETGGDAAEAFEWEHIADALVDGWDEGRRMYEQFAGYWDLEPLLVRDVAVPPVAIDMVLGAERVAGSQLIKQADVLMRYHLVPEEVVGGSMPAALAFYEPRCAHGSSLSPAIHASLFARAGDAERALDLFRLAARLDLDDLTGTTAAGLHVATMGGVWQALAHGFLGLRAGGDVLDVDPCLPAAWESLGLRFLYRGRRVRVVATHDRVDVECDAPVDVRVGAAAVRCAPPGHSFTYARRR
jgi:trehalose/maltose hydrolase-like predicted phosphorylase